MVRLIEQNLPEIKDLCDRSEVNYLDLVGSAVGPRFDASKSDIDFLVDFHRSSELRRADQYFDLQFGLEDLFGRPIDLIEEVAIRNPLIIEGLNEGRERLYGS